MGKNIKNSYGGHEYWRISVSVASPTAINYLEMKKAEGVNYSRVINSALLEYIANHKESVTITPSHGGDDSHSLEK